VVLAATPPSPTTIVLAVVGRSTTRLLLTSAPHEASSKSAQVTIYSQERAKLR
jgi:hypothetical protein